MSPRSMEYHVIWCTEQRWLPKLVLRWGSASEIPNFPKVWGGISAIKRLILSCQKELVRDLPNWASHPAAHRFQTQSTKCVHYALETSIGLFQNPFRMNLRPVKPCAVIKGTRWLKNNASLIWEFLFYVPEPILRPPSLSFILYLLHHNSQGLGIPANIAMLWVDISR
jgi:hypothetical protein